MIKRHAFSFSGWIVTLLFALAWRHNLKDKKEYEKEVYQEELRKEESPKNIKIKPKKLYFAIESFNACELHDATCVDDYNLQRAFLRDHFNNFGKNNENWNVVLKFFINGKQYGKFLYHGEDLAFRDTRGLNYDSNYDPTSKATPSRPYGTLLGFGTQTYLFYEKIFDFDAAFILDIDNAYISTEKLESTLKLLESTDIVRLRENEQAHAPHQLALNQNGLRAAGEHSYLQFAEHPTERNMTTINGFTMPHKIEWHDISKLKHSLHQRMTSGELSYGESYVLSENPDIYEHYFGVSKEDYRAKSNLKSWSDAETTNEEDYSEIDFYLTPISPCKPEREDPKANFQITSFLVQTRYELLQRKLFREQLQKDGDESKEKGLHRFKLYSKNNFYFHIMGRANKRELYEYTRSILLDDELHSDIIISNYTEEHENILYLNQEISRGYEASLQYIKNCGKNFGEVFIIGRLGSSFDFEIIEEKILKMYDEKMENSIICLEELARRKLPSYNDNQSFIISGTFPKATFYPDYCVGAFLVSKDTALKLLETVRKVPRNRLRIEDVYISGMVREAAKINILDAPAGTAVKNVDWLHYV